MPLMWDVGAMGLVYIRSCLTARTGPECELPCTLNYQQPRQEMSIATQYTEMRSPRTQEDPKHRLPRRILTMT